MRPSTRAAGGDVYECFTCGARTEGTQTRICASCGGELHHLGRSRDL